MGKKISIRIFAVVITMAILSAFSLLAFPLGISWWKAELISVCSGLGVTFVTLIIDTIVYVSKRNA